VKGVNLQLGGVWAVMRNQNEGQMAKIAELEIMVNKLQEGLQNREIVLDAFKEKLLQSESVLEEERTKRVDNQKLSSEERISRSAEAEAHREEMWKMRDAVEEIRRTNARFAIECEQAVVAEQSAVRESEVAMQEQMRTEEENRLMGDRLEKAEHEREQLQKQVQQLSLALEKTEVQRDTHCAHADLLLKEKNRYGAEVARLRRENETLQLTVMEGNPQQFVTPRKSAPRSAQKEHRAPYTPSSATRITPPRARRSRPPLGRQQRSACCCPLRWRGMS